MNLEEILKLNPNSSCRIYQDFTEEWKHCYFQYKNESNSKLDPNNLPLLDDQYIGETGDLLYNDNKEEVFDPKQEIHEERYLEIVTRREFTSFEFIKLIQEKIKELKEQENDCTELTDLFDLRGRESVFDLCEEIVCKDLKFIDEKEDENILWFSSLEIDTEHSDIRIEESKEEDLKNDSHKEYYYDNKLKCEGELIKGKKEGLWKLFKIDGKLDSEVIYKEDEPYDGVWRFYDGSGKLYLQQSFKKGEKEGPFKINYTQSSIDCDYTVEKQEGNYKNDNKHGVWKCYNENETLVWEGNFENDKKNGKCQQYHINGKLMIEGSYKDNMKTDVWKFYDKEGQFECDLLYKDGEGFEGIEKDYTDGFLSKEEKWENGLVVERKRFIGETGKITFHGFFENDKLKSGGHIYD